MNVRYRPIRLGFCVQKGDLIGLDRALRLAHTLWGGRFCPIIPVGVSEEEKELPKALVDAFNVDALYPITSAATIEQFIADYPYLPWPKYDRELFIRSARGTVASFLDVYHPLRSIHEEHIKDKLYPRVSSTLYEWGDTDPLKDVLLATFGAYPSRDEIGKDYSDFFVTNLKGKRVALATADPLPADSYRALTPSALSAFDLEWIGWSGRGNPGLYIGDSGSFEDIVDYWNLRAANVELLFYDPAYSERLLPLRNTYIEVLQKRPTDPNGWLDRIAFWSRSRDIPQGINLAPNAVWSFSNPAIWNGIDLNPRSIYISERSVLASIGNSETRPSFSFQLPEKPFFDDAEFFKQSVVVSLRPIMDIFGREDCTIKPPHIPELNEYYGREVHFNPLEVRSEPEGIGIVTGVTDSDLTIRALPSRELIARIFGAFGMKVEPSQPGLVASRLIKQMGGLQGCRVFKIAGVRDLIDKYGPMASFTRGAAIQIIGQNDPATGRPNFANFENLYVDQRDVPKLKPEHAFTYLTENGVFRAGLKLTCPHCQLDFWLALDDIATEVKCELCGNAFKITSQLRDRDWAYRRSGLFGREDHQQGSIPVAVTLQQMDTMFSGDMIYCTAMNIAGLTADVAPCETDFVIVSQRYYERRIPLAIGECKAKGEITEQDVQNLKRVADAFQRTRIEPFIVFAKTGSFKPEEIARCQAAQIPYRSRVILLSDREPEPYFVYERTDKEFEIHHSAISFEDLARATEAIYFNPIPKRQPGVGV